MKKWILITIFTSLVFLSLAFVLADYRDGIQLEYLMYDGGGTAVDETNGKLNATSHNIDWVTDEKGDPAIWFDAQGDSVETNAEATDFVNISDGNWTIGFRMNASSRVATDTMRLLDHTDWWIQTSPTQQIMIGSGITNYPFNYSTPENEWHTYNIISLQGLNVSLWVDGVYNDTVPGIASFGNGINASLNWSEQGSWFSGETNNWVFWNRELTSNEIYTWNLTSGIRVNLNTPIDASVVSLPEIEFNATLTAITYNITNATTYLWYLNSTPLNLTAFSDVTGDTNNNSVVNISGIKPEDYEWNVYTCGVKNDDAAIHNCWLAPLNFSFGAGARINEENHSETTYETANESFQINITSFEGYTPTNAYLWYNGTEHSATITNTAADNYTIQARIDTPITLGSNIFYYKWDLGDYTQQTNNYTQTLNPIYFTLCNATWNTPFVNFSFEDEETTLAMNGTIAASTWDYWLGNGNVNKTYTYSTTENYTNYSFCFSANETLTLDYSIQYSFVGYPQRKKELQTQYTNVTTHTTLYLLSSSDGIYVTFQVLSASGNPLDGIFANATREIGGSTEIVGAGTTGGDGGVTFWVNPDYEHTFTFDGEGYDILITTITPTQSTYSIYLNSVSGDTDISEYTQGINYWITPIPSVLNNNTAYLFNFSITSTYYDLDSFGFVLLNGSGTTLATNSSTSGTGGAVTYTLNTGLNESIVMNYYYVIDGNYTNYSVQWYVANIEEYGFGLKTFFIDLVTYTNDGIFGLNEFSRTLIIFFIIFLMVGGMCYISGIYSPAAIAWEVFALTALFDYGAAIALGTTNGLIPTPINAIAHFPTIFMLFIAIGFTIREALR